MKSGFKNAIFPACASWAVWVNPLTLKHGSGTTSMLGTATAPSSTPGGRPRQAAFSLPRCPERIHSNPGVRHSPSLAFSLLSCAMIAANVMSTKVASCASSTSWPAMMRTMWGDHDRFIDTYFTMYNDKYFTGDGCRKDEDGDYWLDGTH